MSGLPEHRHLPGGRVWSMADGKLGRTVETELEFTWPTAPADHEAPSVAGVPDARG